MTSYRVLWQFSKYAAVGILGFGLDIGLFYVFTRFLGLPVIPANILSVLIVIVHNFFWHKYITFKAKESQQTKTEFRRFFIVSFSAFLIQELGLPLLLLLPLEQSLGSKEDLVDKFLLVTIVGITGFVINRGWTFNKKTNQNLLKQATSPKV